MKKYNLEVLNTLNYDVVVIGGGFAGVGAAVSSAENGAKTLLIECGGELGGDITKGLVPQLLDLKGKGGLVKKLYEFLKEGNNTSARRGPRYDENGNRIPGTIVNLEYVKYYLEKLCTDAGVDVMLHSMFAGCETTEGKISSLAVATECGSVEVTGKIFVDATGNGLLAFMAGCEWETGHPVTGQPQPAGMSMYITNSGDVKSTDTDEDKAGFKRLLKENGIDISAEGVWQLKSTVDDVWYLIFNSQFDLMMNDPIAFSKASIEGRAECVEVLEKLRKMHGYEKAELLQISSHIGVREGRRIKGRYTLTFEDITKGRKFEDAVCTVRFPIDVHRISGDDKREHTRGKAVEPYHIPYRSLIPLGCDNLLLAGRCISGDFYAHASYRVAGNVMPTGEASGCAAALCIKENLLPSDIDGRKISEYMKSKGYEI